jgi:hypothetical protein
MKMNPSQVNKKNITQQMGRKKVKQTTKMGSKMVYSPVGMKTARKSTKKTTKMGNKVGCLPIGMKTDRKRVKQIT